MFTAKGLMFLVFALCTAFLLFVAIVGWLSDRKVIRAYARLQRFRAAYFIPGDCAQDETGPTAQEIADATDDYALCKDCMADDDEILSALAEYLEPRLTFNIIR